jgi:hypothetical protein
MMCPGVMGAPEQIHLRAAAVDSATALPAPAEKQATASATAHVTAAILRLITAIVVRLRVRRSGACTLKPRSVSVRNENLFPENCGMIWGHAFSVTPAD